MAPMTEPEVPSTSPNDDSWPDDVAYYPGGISEIAIWAGEAIASGVLGNAVYDGLRVTYERWRAGYKCLTLGEVAYALVSNRCRQVDLPCPPLRDFKLVHQEPGTSMLMRAANLEALLVLGAEGEGIEVTLRMTAPDGSDTIAAD